MNSTDVKALLPAVIRQTIQPETPGAALLQIMEELHAPSERILAEIDRYFNPYRAPDAFVHALAVWVDLDRFGSRSSPAGPDATWPVPLEQLREWVAAAARLARRRGTPEGLRQLLEVATGVHGYRIIEGVDREGRPRPFHLRIVAPPEAAFQQALVERIIKLEKPAYMTTEPVDFTGGDQPSRG